MALRASVLLAGLAVGAAAAPRWQPSERVQRLLANMTLRQKVGQTTQLDASTITTGGALDPAKLAVVLGNYSVGNILNAVAASASVTARDHALVGGCFCNGQNCVSTTSQAWWSNFTAALQVANAQLGNTVPILYGTDSVHGAIYLDEAVWTPHNVNLGAAMRPDLVAAAAVLASLDTRSMGISWVFAPTSGLGMDPRWSRFYETAGESPYVGAVQAAAYLSGVEQARQQLGGTFAPTISTVKHYLAYSHPRTGKDRTDSWLPPAYLKDYFQPAFEAGLREGMKSGKTQSVMVNSASVAGVPAHASAPLLTTLLREEIGCEGCVALSDWQDVIKLTDYHALAPTYAEGVRLAFEAGLDMSMVPTVVSGPSSWADALYALVANGTIPESRLDESVARILQLKEDMGLFEYPAVPPQLAGRKPGQPADFELALNISRQSMTLLQNGASPKAGAAVLPLPGWLPAGATIAVVGPSSVGHAALCGGWTQRNIDTGNGPCGSPLSPNARGDIVAEVTLQASALGYKVVAAQGSNWTDYTPAGLQAAAAAAAAADVVVFAIGEAPERETAGDLSDLTLPGAQLALYSAIAAAGKPIVTVAVMPRPRLLGPVANSSAFVMAYLPCIMGGQAIAETLLGTNNPSGRLPYTYPSASADLETHFHKPWNPDDEGATQAMYFNPLFPAFTGLSYSRLSYSNAALSASTVPGGASVTVSVTVTNAGPYDADESVVLFVRQLFREAITPEVAMVRGYSKVHVPAGGSVTAQIALNTSDLAYWSPALEKQLDAGVYNVTLGIPADARYAGPLSLTLTSGGRFEYRGPGEMEFVSDAGAPQARAAAHFDAAAPLGVDELMAAVEDSGALDGGPVARALRRAQLRDRLAALLERKQAAATA